ncbi:MAG: hypothetical protein NTU44_16465 [Bacteroidetes bacterium]|nr:hypothetical protein [Bacteroidota bacterium]
MFKKILKVSEKVLLVLFLSSYVVYTILNIGMSRLSPQADELVQYCLMGIVVLFAIIVSLRKISNLIIFLLAVLVVELFIFFITPIVIFDVAMANTVFIALAYIVVFFKSFFLITSNGFLKLLILVASPVIIFYLLYMLIELGIEGDTNEISGYYYFVYILFVIISLAMIFGLPNSNFVQWNNEHRQIFYRLILSVWLFIFIFSTLKLFIHMERYRYTIFPELNEKWGMKDYSIEPKTGYKK